MRTPHPAVVGVVEIWHNEDGWGVLRTPDGIRVWCHFSHVVMDGYKELIVGEQVRFDYEIPGKDGWEGCVLTRAEPAIPRVAPASQRPGTDPPDEPPAYWSSLTLTWDEAPPP